MATAAKKPAAKKAAAKPATPAKDKLNAQDLAASYNYAYALLQSDPELKKMFNLALTDKTGQWTAAKFVAKLRTTDWYRKHSETWRTSEALRITDPEAYKAKVAETKASVIAMASSMGASLTDKEINDYASLIYRSGYSEQQARAALAAHIDPPAMPGGLTGDAGKVEDQLRATALRNGQSYSDSFYLQAAQQVVAGSADIQHWEDQIRQQAATAYPVFADKITAGMDVADLASGYVNKQAEVLEVDPSSITLADPHIKQALGGIDETGNPTAMGMWDFEKSLRADPRWQRTKGARDQTDSATVAILQSFGFM